MQILLAGPGDYTMSGGTSRCMQMVQRAATNRQSRLMFTPTLFWVDANYKQRKSVNSQVPPQHIQQSCLWLCGRACRGRRVVAFIHCSARPVYGAHAKVRDFHMLRLMWAP
jgi:hypothetical protein